MNCYICGEPIESGEVRAGVADLPFHVQCFKDAVGLYQREVVLLPAIRKAGTFTTEQIDEYVKEAEHQEGYAYWLGWSGVEELKNDVQAYFDSHTEWDAP